MDNLIERYKLAEKAGAEGVWDWDLLTDALYLSPRFQEFLDLEPRQGAYRPEDWLDRVHPEDIDWLFASFEAQVGEAQAGYVAKSGGVSLPFQIEHRVRRGDGGWRWLLCRGVAVFGDDGQPARMVGAVLEITERKIAEVKLRQSEQRYALAAQASNDGLYDWDLAKDSIYYSPRWKSILGFAEEEIGTSPEEWFSRVLPEDRGALKAALAARPNDENNSFQIEYQVIDAQGVVRWMLCRGIIVLDPAGQPVRVVGSQGDITSRKLAEQQLRQSEERYALAARGANDGLWDWRLDSDEVYYSPRWKTMLGYDDSAIGNRPTEWFDRVLPDDLPCLQAAIDQHLEGYRDQLEHEFRMRHADGSALWCLVRGLAVRDDGRRPVRMAGSMTDITARKRAEEQLLFDAFHDGLTGLSNRTLLLDRIGQSIDRLRRGHGKHFAVLIIDLDRFNAVNDSLGAAGGNQVLTIIANRLKGAKCEGDTVARLSADEFSMLVDDVPDVAAALAVARSLAAVVAQAMRLDDQDLVMTATIGVALSITGYDSPEDMLRDANLAMVRAKSGGRGRIDVFDTALREGATGRLRLESELRAAIEQDQLCLFYQPIVVMESGRTAGFEALMRWRHPERGLVSPAEFIPLAEESGLIMPMGAWALREATRQAAEWQRRFPQPTPLFMSVNVSSYQFRNDDMLARVTEALATSGIPPDSLKLEITESLLMQDPKRSQDVMRAIRDLDVRLSIDDFGTGYSSLSYLHQFPVDTLKIDRSFVSAITTGGSNAAIVHVIASLAAILRLDVVAEGIEKEEEAQFLRDVCCTYGQGYLFARPLPADQIPALLEAEAAKAG